MRAILGAMWRALVAHRYVARKIYYPLYVREGDRLLLGRQLVHVCDREAVIVTPEELLAYIEGTGI